MTKKIYLIPILFLALILSSISVHADLFQSSWNLGTTSSASQNAYYGWVINLTHNVDINVTQFCVHTNSNPNQWRIYENGTSSGGTFGAKEVASGTSFTANNCVNTSVIFYKENPNYVFVFTNTGGSWTVNYQSGGYPTLGSSFDVVTGYNNGVGGFRYDERELLINMSSTNYSVTPPASANFTITAYNSTTTSQLLSYTASINGSTYNSDGGGLINTTLATSNGGIYPLSVNATGFYPYLANVNISTNWRANLTQFSLNFINQTPSNTTQYNTTSVTFNFSTQYNGTPITTHCFLNLNSNTGLADETFTTTNGTLTSSNQVVTASDGLNVYNWTCSNAYFNKTSISNEFYVDTTFPSITTNFLNNSVYYLSNITASFNFTDDQTIFMYNVSIDGITKGIRYNNGTSNNDTYNLNENPQWLGIGQHTLTAIIADGHTAEKLKDNYKISTGVLGDVLELKTNNNIKIQAKDKSLSDKWSATQKTDRYEFTYQPSKKKTTQTFTIDTDQPIYIINRPDLEYKAWLVSGNKWIDFKIKGQDDFTIDIKRTKNNQAEVTIGNIKDTSKIEFESIGELNIRQATYSFHVINATETHQSTALETESVTFNLTINRTSGISSPPVSLLFNGQSMSVSTSSGSNLTHYTATTQLGNITGLSGQLNGTWTINLTNQETVSFNQNTQSINISNCSGAINEHAINFSVYLEGMTTQVNTNGTIFISVWLNDKDKKKTFSYTNTLFNFTSICIYTNRTINSDIDFTYQSSTATRKWYARTLPLNKTTQSVSLYVLLAGNTNIVNLVNELNVPLKNYFLEMYYVDGFGDYILVQSEKIDFNGNALFVYNPLSKYRFNVLNETGSQIYDFGEMVIAANPLNLKIGILGSDYWQTTLMHYFVTSNLYNVSDTIYLSWENKEQANEICLKITKESITNKSTVYLNCSSTNSGILSYNLTNITGTYYAYSYMKGSTYAIASLIHIIEEVVLKFYDYLGIDALLMQFVLVLAFGLMFSWNPSLMGIGVVIASLFGMLLGLMPVTPLAIISLAVIAIATMIILRG